MVESELPAAIASDPDIVTVWTGSNDLIAGVAVEAFRGHLDRLLGDLSTRTTAQVFVADLVDLQNAPRFRLSPDPDVTPERVTAFNAALAEVAAAHGCVLVLFSDTEMTDDLFAIDGFHPNNAGHALLAERFWQDIEPRL
jgi:lysophospholipase L1-like esterase